MVGVVWHLSRRWLTPKVTRVTVESPCNTHHPKLKQPQCQLRAKISCAMKETNWISLIYLKALERAWLKTKGAKLLTCLVVLWWEIWEPLVKVNSTMLGHIYMKSIRPWLLRILELSLVENVMRTRLRFTWGQFRTTPYNIFNEWKIYMESRMACMDNVGWDCRGFFLGSTLEGRPHKMCDGNLSLH